MKTHSQHKIVILKFIGAIILSLNFNFGIYAQFDCVDPSLIDPMAFCPTVYAPVCGCDNVTYSNSCVAINQGGVTSWTQGECSSVGICVDSSLINNNPCPSNWDPVCACNGVTYGNTCEAENWGGVTSWTPGICSTSSTCVDSSMIDLTIACPLVVIPVCGCDGITYLNACEAFNYGGVTTWTPGICNGAVTFADPCTDLAGIDFGACALFLGYGLVNGVCAPISGCGTVVNNIDYVQAISSTEAECLANCGDPQYSEPCDDLMGIDFGFCAMPLGIAVVNNQCVSISGCDWVVGNTDYSPSFYTNMDSCQACLSNQINEYSSFEIQIYPNPTNGKINVSLSSPFSGTLSIVDLMGRTLLSVKIQSSKLELNLDKFDGGTYFLEITNGESMIRKKVVRY